jgi:hypothetical protein
LADAHVQHLLLWTPVPPVLAITFFEQRYNNDPLILQYAHRVLEQHPVHLTFFFVPQIVQALRYDELGKFKFGEDNLVTANLRYYRIRGTIHI